MKLANIFPSTNAWQKLCGMKMNPRFAYSILKYAKLVSSEFAIVEQSRTGLIHELTNTKDGENAEIKPGTSEFDDYVKRFNEILNVESELKVCDIKFDSLISELSSGSGNELSASELSILEPFFTA